MTGPIVRVELELGEYRPALDPDDAEWTPVAYTINAHHVTELSSDALSVRERRLERLTLDFTNDEPDAYEDVRPASLELPTTLAGLEAIAAIIDHARDYVARELAEQGRRA